LAGGTSRAAPIGQRAQINPAIGWRDKTNVDMKTSHHLICVVSSMKLRAYFKKGKKTLAYQ